MSVKSVVKRGILSVLTTALGDDEGMVVLPTLSGPARGMKFRVNLREFIEPLYVYGTYEVSAARRFLSMCQPDWVVWDCGTYLGYYTALFARQVRHVVAFEPDPRNAERTRDNLTRNGLKNFQIVRAAVGVPHTTVDLMLSPDTNSHVRGAFIGVDVDDYSTREHAEESVPVRSLSLDEALDECQPPNFIKVDIEGMEATALEYVERLCTTVRPILAIEPHNPVCDRAIYDFSKKYGYIMTSAETGAIHDHPGSANSYVICTPDEQFRS